MIEYINAFLAKIEAEVWEELWIKNFQFLIKRV
jgi:hypothetical protein